MQATEYLKESQPVVDGFETYFGCSASRTGGRHPSYNPPPEIIASLSDPTARRLSHPTFITTGR